MPTRKQPLIPPGGFIGFGSQTPAVQALLRSPATRKKRRTTTRRKKTTTRRRKKAPTRRRRTTTRKKPARLVKGSLAAKRHMAKLRRMRRKK